MATMASLQSHTAIQRESYSDSDTRESDMRRFINDATVQRRIDATMRELVPYGIACGKSAQALSPARGGEVGVAAEDPRLIVGRLPRVREKERALACMLLCIKQQIRLSN